MTISGEGNSLGRRKMLGLLGASAAVMGLSATPAEATTKETATAPGAPGLEFETWETNLCGHNTSVPSL